MQLIVAVDKNWGIGKNNGLLFHLPEDLEYFKQKTLGKVIVMGKNTLLSFPKSRPLPQRTNIVFSSTLNTENVIIVKTEQELKDELKKYDSDQIFIVGGAKFYQTMLDYCEKAYVTKIGADGEAELFFPNLDENPNWYLSDSTDGKSGDIDLKYQLYINKNTKSF